MNHNFDTLRQVLSSFRLDGISDEKIVPLPGGLSGSSVWKVETPWGKFCLKCMPTSFSVQRLKTIHRAVALRRDAGLTCLTGYCQATSGETFVAHHDHLWELQIWAKGEEPQPPLTVWQKKGMYQAVARFHQVLRNTPHDVSQLAKSEGVAVRLNMLRTWRDQGQRTVGSRLNDYGNPQRRQDLKLLIAGFENFQSLVELRLVEVSQQEYLVEHCIGDPRPENFRFENQQVSGLIDLGSMRRDNIALDISRLASELSTDTPVDWPLAWQSVEEIRPLKAPEKHLAIVLDAANVILTGLKWVQWLLVDGYSFDSEQLVDTRLRHLCYRLEQLKHHPALELSRLKRETPQR
ncbi:phosphotransferase [Blastopirellula marina]|uniref:Aminoglycoside phosphotransferase domain-containing protein n=1 Tax=Blastopirellula marina TaxID=124 RepID=A0A2S8G0K3_9BACT|nr:phosphotransferase [Blastopirellula marina]PQO37975.1 hypothetical protein C5Y98_07750 [Blastopirellula marina]PTL44631.1 hypothetical protein C5Y97_07750 [Blastopirellula marina]